MLRSPTPPLAAIRLAGFAVVLVIGLLPVTTLAFAEPLGPHGGPGPGTVFVVNDAANSVTEYAPGAHGNATPFATIIGANTGLSEPEGIALNPSSFEILVANASANSITEYTTDDNGNEAPDMSIVGADTGLDFPDAVAADAAGDIFVANSLANSVTEYSVGAIGDATPTNTIMGSATHIDRPEGLAIDAAGDLFVTSADNVITEFGPGATGDAVPTATITGAGTNLNGPFGPALDASGNLFIANSGAPSVTKYASGANGNVAPTATITGPSTGLSTPEGVAFDSAGNLYVANESGKSITEYADGAHGNATPTITISGSNTGLDGPRGITVRPGLVPAKLVFTTQPSDGTPGSPFGSQPAVAVQDAAGHVVTTDSSAVTLSITPGTGTSGANLTCASDPVNASSGVATFSGCAISKAGTGYTLHATDGTLTTADSAPISIVAPTALPIAQLTWSPRPIASPGSLGPAQTVHLAVTALDADSQPIPGALVYMSFRTAPHGTAKASCDGSPSLPGYCTADQTGQVHVTYKTSANGLGGTDTLEAAVDPFGTLRASDDYAYLAVSGAHASRLVWNPSPIAPAQTLPARHRTTATLIAMDSSGNPVPHAGITVKLMQAPGSDATISSLACTAVAGHPQTLACHTGSHGELAIHYTTASTPPAGGSDAIDASTRYTVTPVRDIYSYIAIDHLAWSPVPIAPPATLGPLKTVNVTVTAFDSHAKAIPNTVIYVSLKRAVGSTAKCGTHFLPAYCPADRFGQVDVVYTTPSVSLGGTDRLVAAVDKFGTGQSADSYTYAARAGTRVTNLAWNPSPVAPAATLAPGARVTATVTALDAHGSPVPQATLRISLSLAPNSNAAITGTGCTAVTGQLNSLTCHTGSTGQVAIHYTSSVSVPRGGSDAIEAATGSLTPVPDVYSYQAIDHLSWNPDPVAAAGSLAPATTVDLTVTAFDSLGNPIPHALVYVALKPVFVHANSTLTCSGNASLPGYCMADNLGQVDVTYKSTKPSAADGSDELLAAADPFGTDQVSDSYTYPAPTHAPVAKLIWNPRPVAPAKTLTPGQHATVTLTAVDAKGSPVAGASVDVSLTRAPGSNATIRGTSCTALAGHPGTFLCTTSTSGQVTIRYSASSPLPAGGSDGINAALSLQATPVTDIYSYG